jgi:CrcB protein
MLRYWMGGAIGQRWGTAFPWGTLCVNVLGCSFIGFFATVAAPDGRFLVSTATRQFVMVGVCGGFTTFSSFSLETLNLARDGEWARAVVNILGSTGLCLIGVWLGYVVGREV